MPSAPAQMGYGNAVYAALTDILLNQSNSTDVGAVPHGPGRPRLFTNSCPLGDELISMVFVRLLHVLHLPIDADAQRLSCTYYVMILLIYRLQLIIIFFYILLEFLQVLHTTFMCLLLFKQV